MSISDRSHQLQLTLKLIDHVMQIQCLSVQNEPLRPLFSHTHKHTHTARGTNKHVVYKSHRLN